MGCDIHAYVVAKLPYENETGFWVEGDFSIDRNYDLFANMAGVRNYDKITPVAPERGIMPDLEFRPDWFTNQDGHSHSWLTFDEFKIAIERSNAGTSAQAVLAFMKVYLDAGRDPRIVFCFDN
jgi:hypothetical protein